MTQFKRRGHWRTSKYGNVHWVSEHYVDHDGWSRDAAVPPPQKEPSWRLEVSRGGRSFTARFVNPNARCPICGEPVYFYQNEHGSRVFFDELSPPWPKHPCTDSGRALIPREFLNAPGRVEPGTWVHDEPIGAGISARDSRMLSEAEFENRYRGTPWVLAQVAKREGGAGTTFFTLLVLRPGVTKVHYASYRYPPETLKEGVIVALHGNRLSFFDTAEMAPLTIEVTRYRDSLKYSAARRRDVLSR